MTFGHPILNSRTIKDSSGELLPPFWDLQNKRYAAMEVTPYAHSSGVGGIPIADGNVNALEKGSAFPQVSTEATDTSCSAFSTAVTDQNNMIRRDAFPQARQ